MEYSKYAKTALTVAASSIAYAILSWVPFAGPLIVGVFTGYLIGGGFGNGFKAGLLSGCIGTVAAGAVILYILPGFEYQSPALTLFLVWAFSAFNLVGVAVNSMASGVGAVLVDMQKSIPRNFLRLFQNARDDSEVEYRICPACGQGNIFSADTCVGCGGVLN
jgi:hypothetical protein